MKIRLIALIALLTLSSACTYKFSGASTDGLKSVNVRVFENNAPLVVPTLANALTEALKTRIRNQTRLSVSTGEADAVFEGRITGYDIKPVALQGTSTPTAGANRLTITVSVKYRNNVKDHEKESFEESFTKYLDYSPTAAAIPAAIENINRQLTEDIFNRAFAQW
ncbi:LptE family protein [Pedobacter sp. BMA]|uniref:LptE family protein n=1 Tax=Pedobacter sp. BMA TaxID=1663685 RepID=UPI000649F241|nr:LptE family protein [Pedobacter sp. BMA]KLT64551.1 hypothetical protein AB669_12340 [Pedobacter sp. BMA]